MLSLKATIPLIAATWLCSRFENPSDAADQRGPKVTLEQLAGQYYHGGGTGSLTIELNANGHYSYSWQSHDGGYQRDEGTAEVVDDFLSLHPQKTETNRPSGRNPQARLLAVRWGTRFYLVPDGEILDFCDWVNLGLEPREGMYGRFYLRMVLTEELIEGREELRLEAAGGLPELPTRWAPYLLKRPLQGEVIEVLKDEQAIIDLGLGEGLKVGMELFYFGEENALGRRSYGLATVVVAEAHRCTVKVKHPDYYPGFKKNQKVSSKIPKGIIEHHQRRPSFWD